MNTCSFFRYRDLTRGLNTCNCVDLSRPLIVNCAGCVSTFFAFSTDNLEGRDDYYFMALTEGELFLPQINKTARAGDVIIFPPNTRYVYDFSGEKHLCYFWAHFTGSYVQQFLKELSLNTFPNIRRYGRNSELISHFRKIFDLYLQGGELRDILIASQLERVLINIAGVKEEEQATSGTFLRSISYMHAQYNTDIRIPMLAKIENLSVSRYSAVFNKLMGMSPQRYLIALRMQNACELLRNTDMNIRQIGMSVGYDDPHFFSKIFKKHMGVSPIDYRNA